MLIVGEWQVGDDGTTRPVVRVEVLGLDGSPISEGFLVDTGADRTVLSAAVLDHFDIVLSRRRNEVLLLAPNHRYHIERG